MRDANIVVLPWPHFARKNASVAKSDQKDPPLGFQPPSARGSCSGLFPHCSLALGQRSLHTWLLSDSEIRLVPEGAQLWAEYGVEL